MATYTYVDIPNSDVAVGAPVDTALMTAQRDNALAIGEGTHPDIPDIARHYLALGTVVLSPASSAVFSSLDLTRYNFVAVELVNLSGSTTGSVTIGSTTLGAFSTTNTNGIVLIGLDNGALVQDQFLNAIPATGITRVSTSVTVTFSSSVNGTVNLYGVK